MDTSAHTRPLTVCLNRERSLGAIYQARMLKQTGSVVGAPWKQLRLTRFCGPRLLVAYYLCLEFGFIATRDWPEWLQLIGLP